MKLILPVLAACLVTLLSCNDAEIGNSKDVNPATIYTKYFVYYNAGDSDVSFRALFCFAGPNGTTLVLNSPAKVALDGDTLTVDSTKEEGAFYQVKKPATAFGGEHVIVFTNIDGQRYTHHFTFTKFRLADAVPEKTNLADLSLAFEGLRDNDSINIALQDTAGNNIDTVFAIRNNTIIVPGRFFARLKGGPLTLQAGRGYSTPLENATAEGGLFNFMYILPDRKITLNK